MAVGHLKVGKLNFTFVFRHRFEKKRKENPLDDFTLWMEWELGFFFRRLQTVGKKNFHNPNEWKNNHVYMYMLGLNLLWCKAWFTVDRGSMNLGIE
jgi:hypothetical protein